MIIGGLIVTHGELGEILVKEASRIAGESEKFTSLRTTEFSADEISEKVRAIITDEPWIVFTDCPGTAPTLRSQIALSAGQAVITGVNLAMIISFLLHREINSVEEMAERMIRDGKRSMEILWQGKLHPRKD
ncbi:MAG: hypothetical protein P9L92_04415 [Candidatus Electryonea clarkiae]|nr:hypothetical protein [Candidatus Electryonea clarkiae]MDP8286547.1 hypothetical protein [Candidatus Electryonea clarkiae]